MNIGGPQLLGKGGDEKELWGVWGVAVGKEEFPSSVVC